MNLLFAINDKVVDQLLTTIYSIYKNTPDTTFDIYILQKELLKRNADIMAFCDQLGVTYHPVVVGADQFADAPVTDRYPATIYYRLLAQDYLPETLERILYLDIDILVINDLSPLYNLDFGGQLYAAASHTDLTGDLGQPFNKVRLGNYEAESYYNSGVILYNLPAIRQTVRATAIFNYIEANKIALFLPDQDVLNGLYGHQIKRIPDELYNYDTRMGPVYFALGNGTWNLDWVIDNTVILHFCGREKPWLPDRFNRYTALYKHYAHQAALLQG